MLTQEKKEQSSSPTSMSDTSSLFKFKNENKLKKLSPQEQSALRRILRDLKEVRSNPLPDVVAEPLEDNLFVWHGNLRGPAQSPFEGGIFHFSITFPADYPAHSPQVQVFSDIPGHPFVQPGNVCLALTECPRKAASSFYYGWSPIYSAHSILLQLQSVLIDGLEASNDTVGDNVSFSQKQTSQWKVVFDNRDKQGEGTLDPSEIRELLLEVGERKPSEEELALHYLMLNIPKDQLIDFSTFLRILQRKRDYRKVVETANKFHCSSCSHSTAQKINPPFPITSLDTFTIKNIEKLAIEETVCFFSKQSFLAPDTATLGFGISYQRNFRNGKIHKLTTTMDVISLNAFRKWEINYAVNDRTTKFSHWIPLYINAEHGKRAMHLAPRCLGIICSESHRDFKPEMVVDILPKLLGEFVTQIAKTGVAGAVRALKSYSLIHQLFLQLIERYPQISELVAKQVKDFVENPAVRTKDNISNISDFLGLLSVVEGVNYPEVFNAVVEEVNIRNVLWIIKKFPELDKSTPDAKLDKDRIEKSFQASKPGLETIIFHKFFLENVAHPKGQTNAQMREFYEKTLGRPTNEQIENIQVEHKQITSVPDYEEVYRRLGITYPDHDGFLNSLLSDVEKSSKNSYHGKRQISVQSVDEYLKEKQKTFINLEDMIDFDKSKELTEIRSEELRKVPGYSVPAGTKFYVIKSDEDVWRRNCIERFGTYQLPEKDNYVTDIDDPWRHLYLQLNLEDLICKFNDNPDFKIFYRTIELSAEHIKLLHFTAVPVTNLRSNFHYLTALLTKLYHLEKFVVCKGEITLGLKGCKALCKGLKNNPNSLKILDLHYCHFTSECVKIMEEGLLASRGLISLDLRGNPLGIEGAKSIAKVLQAHESIRYLNINSCSIDNSGATELAAAFYHNKSLKVIDFGKNPMGDSGFSEIIKQLAYSSTIEEISCLHMSSVDSANVAPALTKLFEVSISLKKINFYETKINQVFTIDCLHGLSQNRSLTELDLSNTGLTSRYIRELGWAVARNKRINTLLLENISFSDNALTQFSEAIFDTELSIQSRERNAKLRALRADEVQEALRPRGCALSKISLAKTKAAIRAERDSLALSRFISLNPALVELNLSECGLEVLAAEAIGIGMKNHPSLTHLDLSKNNFGEHGIKKLCKGLAENRSLLHLNIARNNSGGRGISAVGTLISNQNCTIQVLNIFGNLIGIEGARFIGKALESNKSVTDLDLGLNRIRHKGTTAISNSLKSNTTLKIIRVKKNFITDRAAMDLAEVIAANKSITKLCIVGNRVKEAILNSIVISLSQRDPPVEVDIAQFLKVTESSRLLRTVYCTPLTMDVSNNALKKVFYDGGCGAIVNVAVLKHSTRNSFDTGQYAFVEFADAASVELALDIGAEGKAKIGKKRFNVIQAQGKDKHEVSASSNKGSGRGGRGGSSGGRGGRPAFEGRAPRALRAAPSRGRGRGRR